MPPAQEHRPDSSWQETVASYQRPSKLRSIWQLVNSVLPYFALLVAMYFSLRVSYWITLALAFPAAGLLIRTFIILHDCGHGSFFASRKANRVTGFLMGVLSFIPSDYWSHEHARHHATAGDLDHRGHGDIWTLTVEEYVALSGWDRLRYRLYRHPFVMFLVGPLYIFVVRYRFWLPGDSTRRRRSVIMTNAAILAIVGVAAWTIGIKAYLAIQGPIMAIAATAGVWLFYVQHNFEGTYWERHEKWDYVREALEGSSFYKLPRILQWFTGNIGFHHVHHLSPRIPNYYLERVHESLQLFQNVPTITLKSSLRSLRHRLWDEQRRRLVGFAYVRVFLEGRGA